MQNVLKSKNLFLEGFQFIDHSESIHYKNDLKKNRCQKTDLAYGGGAGGVRKLQARPRLLVFVYDFLNTLSKDLIVFNNIKLSNYLLLCSFIYSSKNHKYCLQKIK